MWISFLQSDSFISCYFGSRSILSYLDLEFELVEVLRSFMIPSVSTITSTQLPEQTQQNQDPNEINVDDPEVTQCEDLKSTSDTISSFYDYGIGPLYLHPSVSSYFPELARVGCTEHFVTSSNILGCMASSESDLSLFSIEDLESCLCEEFGVSNLLNIGIIITGNLKLEIVMLRHVHAARVKLLTEVQKGLLEEYAIQERKMRETTLSNTQHTRQKKDSSKVSIVPAGPTNLSMSASGGLAESSDCLKSIEITVSSIESTRQGVSSFLTRCSSLMSDSPYSPSFSKVLDAVEKVCREHEKDDKIAGNKRKKRPRGRKTPELTESSAWEEIEGENEGEGEEQECAPEEASYIALSSSTGIASLKEIAAEYVMLCLGGDKYRSKRIRATACVGAETASTAPPVSLPVCLPVSSRPDHGDLNLSEGPKSSEARILIPDSVPGLCGITADPAPTLESSVGVADRGSTDHGPGTPIPSENEVNESCHGDETLPNRQTQSDFIAALPPPPLPLSPHKNISALRSTIFECKLSNHSSVPYPIGKKLQQQQQGSCVYVVSNETLRDLAPWCGVGSWTQKSAGALDTVDLKAVGRWGEALVYQYLLQRSSSSSSSLSSSLSSSGQGTGMGMGMGTGLKGVSGQGTAGAAATATATVAVEWMNSAEETKAVYDLITRETKSVINTGLGASGRPSSITETTYIEVKTTRFDDLNTFEISLWEWQFATANPKVRYHIYRVFNAGDPKKVRIVVIEDVMEMITARRVRLCLNIQ
jgi:Domain of unknown function (DUF3883)